MDEKHGSDTKNPRMPESYARASEGTGFTWPFCPVLCWQVDLDALSSKSEGVFTWLEPWRRAEGGGPKEQSRAKAKQRKEGAQQVVLRPAVLELPPIAKWEVGSHIRA